MSTWWQSLAWHLKTPTWYFKTSTWHFKTSTWHFKTQNMHFKTPNMAIHSVQGTHQQRRCGGQGRRPMAASINTSLFAPSKKITPRPPPSPRVRSASFTTNVLVVPCVATHTRHDKARVPCVASCAARRWRATRCTSPARAARWPSTQATRR
jgi:hypothetical protein